MKKVSQSFQSEFVWFADFVVSLKTEKSTESAFFVFKIGDDSNVVIYHIKANNLSEGGNMIYNQNKVEMLRQRYPEGTRICVDSMDDYCPIESGTCGTVEFVDDAGTLHCKFDNGRTLGVIPDVDDFHVVKQEQSQTDEQTVESTESEQVTETENNEESEEMNMSM